MIEIDGSFGEGGGQILRSALSLSMVTQQPFRITRIRAGRPKPGLAPQHLTGIRAAATISQATVKGDHAGSQEIDFIPRKIQTGRYEFAVGTAGSVSLVFQTLFLPLALAQEPSTVSITGGTHVRGAPIFDFLESCWLSYTRQCGLQIDLKMEKAGYYPKGGGRIVGTFRPPQSLKPLNLKERGQLLKLDLHVGISNLPQEIGKRMIREASELLKREGYQAQCTMMAYPSPGQGIYLWLLADYGSGLIGFSGLGERGVRAEAIARRTVEEFLQFERSKATVDRYLADQLLLPLVCIPGNSFYSTSRISLHLLTNLEVIQKFLSCKIEVEGELGEPGWVRLSG